jgi:hypothetical protein
MEEPQATPARSDSEHYREMASKLRELARHFRFPGARKELLDLAARYERRADNLDARNASASFDQDPPLSRAGKPTHSEAQGGGSR